MTYIRGGYTDSEEWRLITLARHACRCEMSSPGGTKAFLDEWGVKHGPQAREELAAEARHQWRIRGKWVNNPLYREDLTDE